jgi:hypothetical protein
LALQIDVETGRENGYDIYIKILIGSKKGAKRCTRKLKRKDLRELEKQKKGVLK